MTGEFPTQRPVTRKMLPFEEVIMISGQGHCQEIHVSEKHSTQEMCLKDQEL